MEMIDYSYKGFYAHFDTPDKGTGSLLMGPDNIVGDFFEVFFKTEDDRLVAWIKNKFGKELGYFGIDDTRAMQIAQGRGQKIKALLSFVAYSDSPDPGCYWGEMAIFCYSEAYESEIMAFINRCSNKLGQGVRPNIDLGRASVEKIFTESDWLPTETVPLPKKESGMAVLKSSQSLSERMIEKGRARNKGCYAVSWLFIIVLIIGIIYGLHCLGLF